MAIKKFTGYFRVYSQSGDTLFAKGVDQYIDHYPSKSKLLAAISVPFYDNMYDLLDEYAYKTKEEFLKEARKLVATYWSDEDIIIECATGTVIEPLSFGLDKVLVQVVDDLWCNVAEQREAQLKTELAKKAQLEEALAKAKQTVKDLTKELATYA